MEENGISRLSRLTSIITLLQTKKILTAGEISSKFNVSIRTVYRDIRALEAAGVPIFTEEGKGYSLMEGYRLSPIMFTEAEANALITAERLILKNKDASFVKDYREAIDKIRAVLAGETKEKSEMLSTRVEFRMVNGEEKTSNHLSSLQRALTNFSLAKIDYQPIENEMTTTRIVEPFALYSTQGNWLLIALCRLRRDYRTFRLDRIRALQVLDDKFEPHTITLQAYFEECKRKSLQTPDIQLSHTGDTFAEKTNGKNTN